MLLADALHELTTELSVLYTTTQGRLLTRLTQQLTRLSHCEESLRFAVLKDGLRHSEHHRECETLQRKLDESHARHKKLQTRAQQERSERDEERQWVAALWPDDAVLPTILKPFAPEETRFVGQVEAREERRRLDAMVSRRAAKERVLQQLEVAAQWKMVVEMPSTTPETERVAGQTYYQNSVTGESAWDAPVAMFYEPPAQWDRNKMDWTESYALDNFYPAEESDTPDNEEPPPATVVPSRARDPLPALDTRTQSSSALAPEQGKDDHDGEEQDNAEDDDDSSDDVGGTRQDTHAASDEAEGEDEDDDSDKNADPVILRAELEQAFAKSKLLQEQVNATLNQQRALALQLLNATRDSFEREKEALEREDEAVKAAERKKRKAQQEEMLAAKVAAQVREKRALDMKVQTKSTRDSVAKKDMTLSKDDELFEKELQAFAIEQRKDRLYLAVPLATDERVKHHHQLDDEYVHMKHMELELLEVEQTEFDLLEKTALRLEEATKRCEELTELLDKARCSQVEVDHELQRLPQQIAALEEANPPPEEPRPSRDVVERAKERCVVADEDAVDKDDDTDNDEAETESNQQQRHGDQEEPRAREEEDDEQVDDEEQEDPVDTDANGGDGVSRQLGFEADEPSDSEPVACDEAELKTLKIAVEREKLWQRWELNELLRLEDLAAAYDRFKALETMKRRLVVDVPLFASDLQFFEQLVTREKELSDKLWTIQADGQIERARFLMERATREESLFQVKDEYEAVAQRLEHAKRLSRQARNPLERLELMEESKRKSHELQADLTKLQQRYEKEQAAKRLLVMLETRFCEYSQTKLREEAALFAEKQALWDANDSLHRDLVAMHDAIERLYAVLRGDADAVASEVATRASYDEATALFDEKLQRIEATRHFLLLCYERESRWRSLAAVALVHDTTSDAWITNMQRERQEQMLSTLQTQHKLDQSELLKEIKLLQRVKELLQAQITERDARLERLRREYQCASEAVRLETEQIVLGLKDHLEREESERAKEREQAKHDRAQLMEDHNQLVAELQQRCSSQELELEQQWHWLTAAKRELHAQRVANDELLIGYQSLEKRRATETNDMRFRISSQITKINSIEMWNLSLKIQARAAHAERVALQREIERLVLHHKQQQRLLRLENWKHRMTAQHVLTDVDALFMFFAQGLEILAGATASTNAQLRRNGGIELLAVLVQHSCQSAIRVIASKALGQVAWNANVTPRSLGWQAKKLWFQWQMLHSTRLLGELAQNNLEFDSVASEQSREINWLADTSASGGVGESDSDAFDQRKKIRFLHTWNARDDNETPCANSANQEHIGLAPHVLKTIIDLCRQHPQNNNTDENGDDVSIKIQQNALRSLAIVVMNTRNTAIVGRVDGCIPLLVSLLQPTASSIDNAGATRHAIHALANLAFENDHNKSEIYRAGAIPLLLESVTSHRDVDVLLASVQALANLTLDHVPSCERVFDGDGLASLTRLCHSFRIHDAVDLDVYEAIQTCAAETISNVITTLDGGDSPSLEDMQQAPHIERNVALAILSASQQAAANDEHKHDHDHMQRRPPGVSTFVLMCASCTRDVAFHGALVLGSIAQHDDIRAAIGSCGGIDALFLLATQHHDPALVAQATWALANATWNRENQYRVARYLDALLVLATFRADDSNQLDDDANDATDDGAASYSEQIREHGLCILANALFYNDANRQLVASQTQWMTLLQHNCRTSKGATLEHSARALCSLSYSDAVALAMGGVPGSEQLAPARAVNGFDVLIRLCSCKENPLVQKHGLYGVINMCLHDANKAKLLEIPHAIETLVNLSGSTTRELCDPAIEALDLLADVRSVQHALVGSSPAAVLSPSTMSALAASDLKNLIGMLHDATGSPALVAMASDAIADEVWKRPSAKVRLRNVHGLDKLLELCVTPQSPIGSHERVLLSCLWALRNSIADNVRNQDYVGALSGIPQLVALCDRHRQSDDVVEAVLAVLVALVMNHPRNSHELVQNGLDMLLGLAEGLGVHGGSQEEDEEEEQRREHGEGSSSISLSKKSSVVSSKTSTHKKPPTKENSALAKELLLLVAPFNNALTTCALPPLNSAKATAASPEKMRTKKPHNAAPAASQQLPALANGSPLAASHSPSKRSNN